MKPRAALFALLLLSGFGLRPQDTAALKRPGLTVAAGLGSAYGPAMIGLNQYWYKGFERSAFHFFDDRDEWLQMDKAGHFFSAFQLGSKGSALYRRAGLPPKKAALASFLSANLMMAGIEVLDGFSAAWGASLYDLAFNLGGSGLAYGQALLWKEERITVKISYRREKFPLELQPRVEALYGRSLPERILKDYNGLIIWAGFNIHDFLPADSRFPAWLNISAGYGASGLLGARANRWCSSSGISPEDCDPADLIIRDDIPRLRQFYLSPDIDFRKIPHRKKWQGTLLGILNIIKFPAPALELNSDGKVFLRIR